MSDDTKQEILLVEDNPFDAELALRSLRMHNPKDRVVHAADGEEALDYLFCRGPFSQRKTTGTLKMVILDLNLPKVSGLEILPIMKANPQTKAIPVVVLTSSREEQDIIKGYELGVSSYIMKPTMLTDPWPANGIDY